ncbi:nuclear transport factor 2 family protein [Pseudonocardia xinjiangensis]|uniref:Nuclear transport factor 2 family protein n=1 Tax=Pseudonocardia xinjiangensis TaxID=75289 RepID=A0ABX1R5Z9_9PSEU|nr:nuclear transport factor 2 family protein [Pseudonocardia xinjiangensis]NMH75795.1 nuclear transport factor 2 family protein [Pseudonocardia xinjiangensis]
MNVEFVNDMPESRPTTDPLSTASAVPYPALTRAARELFRSIDAMDVAAVLEMFAEDCALRFANQERVLGRSGVRQVIEALFSGIRALNHSITGLWSGTWERGAVVSVESEVTYTGLDGVRLEPLPATSTLRIERGLIQDFRVFMDPSPLFPTET